MGKIGKMNPGELGVMVGRIKRINAMAGKEILRYDYETERIVRPAFEEDPEAGLSTKGDFNAKIAIRFYLIGVMVGVIEMNKIRNEGDC